MDRCCIAVLLQSALPFALVLLHTERIQGWIFLDALLVGSHACAGDVTVCTSCDMIIRRRPRREMDQSLYQQRMQQELGAAAGLELDQHAAHGGGEDQHHGGAAGQVLQPKKENTLVETGM